MNVTIHFQNYKEAIRNLWNTYFYNNGKANWDDDELFEGIDRMLFEKIVLGNINQTIGVNTDTAATMFRLKSHSDGLPIMVNSMENEGRWDHPVTALINDMYEIQFISYFDWDTLGIKDCRYIMSKIISSKNHPEIIGRKALIESQYVDIHFVQSV